MQNDSEQPESAGAVSSTRLLAISEQLKTHFGNKVFNTVIPRNVRLAEAPSYGLPGVVFDPASKGAVAFKAFAGEMVERMRAK